MDAVIGAIMDNPVGSIITVAVIFAFVKFTFGSNNKNDKGGGRGGSSSSTPPSTPPSE